MDLSYFTKVQRHSLASEASQELLSRVTDMAARGGNTRGTHGRGVLSNLESFQKQFLTSLLS